MRKTVEERAAGALARVAPRIAELTSGRILDAGCGEGRFLPPGGIGLDVDFDRLGNARRRSPRVVAGDARALPFREAAFDTVYAHRMLNDTADVDRVLSEIVRVLRPGGALLVFTRARRGEGDRLDRWNGEERLRRHFDAVESEPDPIDERAALFVARRPRRDPTVRA